MTIARHSIQILSSRSDVTPFIPSVIAAADQERESFGFLPERAYEDFAVQERLIVAVDQVSGSLAGYVIFGGTAPQARIFQTYVAPFSRRSGVGRALVEEVVRRTESGAFLSIRVEVARDLETANDFYRDQGFRKVREKAGGPSRGRTLVTRVRELTVPSLLDLATYGEVHGPPVTLELPTRTKPPLYLVDLNVLFDVTKRRGKALAAGRVFAAALDNSVTMAASGELVTELERNASMGKPDPVLELARTLPLLRTPPSKTIRKYTEELGPLLFPKRFESGSLTVQDRSDIAHLATAIEENADGFVTSEKAILSLSDWLREKHRLEVISPEILGKNYTAGTRSSSDYSVLVGNRPVTSFEISKSDETQLRSVLAERDVPAHVIKAALSPGNSISPRRRVGIKSGDEIIAFGSWDPPKKAVPLRRLYLFANEADSAAEVAIDHILNTAARDACSGFPTVFHFIPSPDQVMTRSRAIGQGFRPTKQSSTRVGRLERLCLGQVVTSENWPEIRSAIRECVGLIFPANPPIFQSNSDEVRLTTEEGHHALTSLGALEDFLSPAIFALHGRPAVIVPIKPHFAEALFRGTLQPSFLDAEQAAVMLERRYLSGSSTYGTIPDSGLIVFYESTGGQGGRSAATAVARIRRRYLAQEQVALRLVRDRGVLSEQELRAMARGREVCVSEFDNVMLFENPITLSRLKRIGCADDANLVTARRLQSEALLKLLKAANPTCSI